MYQSEKIVIKPTAESTNGVFCRPSNLCLHMAFWYGAKKLPKKLNKASHFRMLAQLCSCGHAASKPS